MESLNNTDKTSVNAEKELRISDVSGSFYGIGQMCKRCSGDGWVFHSKSGQSGLMKDCPKCDGKGVIKITTNGWVYM
jgi:DnaJ-class molecular chaperone